MILSSILLFFSTTGLSLITLLLPLLSFILLTLLKPHQKRVAIVISFTALLFSFIASAFLFYSHWGQPSVALHSEWFRLSPQLAIDLGLLINPLTVLMLVVVTLVSLLVHLYSIDYMKDDPALARYFSFLGLFTFAMLGIVLSSSLLTMFMFWELVGFSSYLLIGFWYAKPEAAAAAKKAFIVNRIGDLGFVIGIMILWGQFQTLEINMLYDNIAQGEFDTSWLTIAGFCFFAGVMGKSAQFPLQVWLPDAMEGPTPVSALIHAATMVAAGVFLLARLSGFFVTDVLTIIALIGAITAFMGAVAAIHQHDIKKVLAYSTISQLGYMVMGMGVGAFDASVFHLVTHASFKACLFLSAGAVIYSLHNLETDKKINVQDMRVMGGLRKFIPITFWVFVVSGLALMGAPFTSGFLSKDAIITGAWYWASTSQSVVLWIVPALGLISVILTAFYVSRLLLLVFFGKNRLTEHGLDANSLNKLKEPGARMLVPMVLLAVGSLFIVYSLNPLSIDSAWILNGLGSASLTHSVLIPIISTLFIIAGATIAYFLYKPGSNRVKAYATAQDYTNFWEGLSFTNWHLDKIYNKMLVLPFIKVSSGFQSFEIRVVDKAVDYFGIFSVVLGKVIGWIDANIVDGFVGFLVRMGSVVGFFTKSMQTGRAQSQIVIGVLGVLTILGWILFF